jgi:hypothetical protein
MSFLTLLEKRIDEFLSGVTELVTSSDLQYSATEGVFDYRGDHTLIVKKSTLQSKLFKEFSKVRVSLLNLFESEAESVNNELTDKLVYTENLLSKSKLVIPQKTNSEINEKIYEDWKNIRKLLSQIYTEDISEIVIPDTSYVIKHPDFSKWSVKKGKVLNIIITPTVLSELDSHKEFHKDKQVHQTAKVVTKKIRDLMRRNRGNERKTILRDKVYLFLDAVEPKSTVLLEELDFSIPDDRIIASSFLIIRRYANSNCYIASEDVNQINKALYWGIPVKEM